MKIDIELARSSLEAAKTGWYRYLATPWRLNLVLVIDLLTERQFFCGKGNSSFSGLEVPRIAFSFTYSALFGTFIVWATSSARTTREIVCASCNSGVVQALSVSPEYRLWGLSPISRSKVVRIAFWLLTGYGLFLLLAVTVIHLSKYNLPPAETMSQELYQGIGVFCAAIFVLSMLSILHWIFPAWSSIYQCLSSGDKR